MAAIDPKVLVAFELMLGGVDSVERKGVNVPYVAVNGNMYAMISKRDMIGIIVEEQHWRSFELAGGTPFEAVPGIALKGFGALPDSMFKDRLQLQSWFRRAHEAAEKLPPKEIKIEPRVVPGPTIS
jgi:hypothetical protein